MGNLLPGRSTNLDNGRARDSLLAVGADGGCSDIFFLSPIIFFFHFTSLWNGWMGNLWFQSFSTEF